MKARADDQPDTGSSGPSGSAAARFMYVTIQDLLFARISSGELPAGTVLKEARLSHHLGTSRAPVRRALSHLEERGLIVPARGQGYVVGGGGAAETSISPRKLQEILNREPREIERSPAWERILARVVEDVSACMPFGTFRIQEAELGDYHAVSRTVARDVLWRLMDRRLIEKDRKSHWIVAQMTARDLHETIEMRVLLEPAALAHARGGLDHAWLAGIARRVEQAVNDFPSCGADEVDRIEQAMFHTMFERLRNSRLLSSIRRNQISLLVPRLFRQHFPIRDDLPGLRDHAAILKRLLSDDIDAACARLRCHLQGTEALTLGRLRVLSQLPPPDHAPYMTPVY
jgi:DNA-binding GntR family transcriptional regulator